jgi:hypothetical protein
VHFVGKRTYQLSAQYLPVEKYTPVAGRWIRNIVHLQA